MGHALCQVLGERFLFWGMEKEKNRWLSEGSQALCGTFPILKEKKEEWAALSPPAEKPCLRAATWLCSVIWIKRLELKEKL